MKPNFLVSSASMVLATCLLSGVARADDPAAADALFRQARDEVAAGRFAQACPRFIESYRLEPAPGTLLNLADCEEHVGQLAEALEQWQRALDTLPKGDDRITYVRDRLDRLKPRVPHLVLRTVSPSAVVVLDGVDLRAAALGVPIPVNPGTHTIVVRSPGHEDRSYSAPLAEGATVEMDVAAGEVAVTPSISGASHASSSSSSLGALGWASMIAGGVGLTVGAVTGVAALSDASTVRNHCPNHACTSQSDMDTARTGSTLTTVSTVGFGVGIAGVAVGSYLLFVRRDRAHQQTSVVPLVGPQGGGVSWSGSF
jgi:hypothetical protein